MLRIKKPNSLLPKVSMSLGAFIIALIGSIGILSIVDPKENTVVRKIEARGTELEVKDSPAKPDEKSNSEDEKADDTGDANGSAPSSAPAQQSQITKSYTPAQPNPVQPAQEPAPAPTVVQPTAPASQVEKPQDETTIEEPDDSLLDLPLQGVNLLN